MSSSAYSHKRYSKSNIKSYSWTPFDLYITLCNIVVENLGEALSNLTLIGIPVSSRLIIMAISSTINMVRMSPYLIKTVKNIDRENMWQLVIISLFVLVMSLCSFYGLYKRDLRLKSALAVLEPIPSIFIIHMIPMFVWVSYRIVNLRFTLNPVEKYQLTLVISLLAPATYYYKYYFHEINSEILQISTLLLMGEYIGTLACDNLCEYYFKNMGALPSMMAHIANVSALLIIIVFDPAVFEYYSNPLSLKYPLHLAGLLFDTIRYSGSALVIYYFMQYFMLAAAVPTSDMYELPGHLQTYLLVWDSITFSNLVTMGYYLVYTQNFNGVLKYSKIDKNNINQLIKCWIQSSNSLSYLMVGLSYALVMVSIGPAFLKLGEFKGIILASSNNPKKNKFDILKYFELLLFGGIGENYSG